MPATVPAGSDGPRLRVVVTDAGWVPESVLRVALVDALGLRRGPAAWRELCADGRSATMLRTEAAANRAARRLRTWSLTVSVELS
jgi:hypothetical protein